MVADPSFAAHSDPRDRYDDPLLDSLLSLCALHQKPVSRAMLTAGLPLPQQRLSAELLPRAAARAGLQEGDVIVAVANTNVADVKEFDAAVAKLDKAKPVSILFRRGDWAQYALIRPAR